LKTDEELMDSGSRLCRRHSSKDQTTTSGDLSLCIPHNTSRYNHHHKYDIILVSISSHPSVL